MAKTKKVICKVLLRILALGATLLASIIMATSHQTTSILGMKFEAKFDTEPAFKYFVIMNAVGAIYSLVILFLRSESFLRRFVLALDVIVAMLLASSISAALAIAYVGKKGNSHAGWLPICGQVPKFCDHVTGALISGFIGMIIYFLLLVYSIQTTLNPMHA